ncbi:MAG: hypothetical protein PHQ43_06415 [Dehalococcoidales bacterium]|nr:hypothetical protein [Dehalococcoidales bacterium]
MPDLHIFKAAVGMFDPAALQDQNVCIHYQQQRFYRQVDFLESIPPFQCADIGALAAQTRSARTQITNLDMPDDEFGLFRWYCLDNAQIYLFLPTGVAKFELKNIQVPYDYKTTQRDPNLVSTEFCVWQDNRPAVEALNGMDYALSAVRIIAMGYRFHTFALDSQTEEAIKAGRIYCTHVWCSGRGQG